ncbi:MAG: hypothetical protein Q9168_005582 [Polycauliona sp. 1 TL-2023]
MDLFLGKVTQQAMNYAIRSGITITASYAIKQSARLLKTVEGNEKEELQDLQERLDSKIKIISPAIDMIELISARGNTTLESAVSLTKSLRREIQALGQRLAEAANADERAHSGKLKAQEKLQHELELKRVVQSIKRLLAKIDDAVPMINLAITASGTNLSSGLPSTVSPSRLLQASTFLTAGDSQYSLDPSKPVQIGPTFTLSMYMLFAGHVRPQYEEDIRESTWKEVMHKANVKLMRIPLDDLYKLPGEKIPASKVQNGSTGQSPELANSKDSGYLRNDCKEGGRPDEYAYQLLIVEDLEDDRVHTFEDDEAQPGPFGDITLAGIREALPIHELSKIFYADTGKILNIGTDGEVNNPILLLKRDINAIPPRKMMARKDEAIPYNHDTDTPSRTSMGSQTNGHGGSQTQLVRTSRSMTPESSTPRKNTQLVQAPNPWRIPLDLDPEWLAFEVYTETEDSDAESEPDASSRQRAASRGSNIITAMSDLDIQSANRDTSSSPFPKTSVSDSAPQLPPIRTSLSLLEMLLRLLSLQQFQQTPHLSIPDELLTFFLSESASTGAANGDVEARKRVRDDARRRVGFDPYDESPIKRRGEDYQYRDQRDGWNAGDEYGGTPYTPEHGIENDYDTPPHEANSSHGFIYQSPLSASGRSASNSRSPMNQHSPLLLKNHRSRSGTPSSGRGLSNTPPARWRPSAVAREDPTKRGSPLARPGTGFTDEGLGSIFNALKELRLPDRERWLWIDAICINQGNLQERGWQVALMDSIYRNAQSVTVWLGRGSPQLNHPHCPTFSVIRDADNLPQSKLESIRDSIQELLLARWWSRVWVVQEIALARVVAIRSGRNEVPWNSLAVCLRRLATKLEHGLDPKILSFFDTIAELKTLSSDHERSLLDLAVRFRDRVAGNPRDKLLGYLGLLRQPATASVIQNPYANAPEEVFAHFTAYCIESSGSLATMAIAEGSATHKVSWAVDWTTMTSPDWRNNDPLVDQFGSKEEPPMAFWNGDLLPSVGESTGRRYNATQSLPATCGKKRLLWNSLNVEGWNPDAVASYGDVYRDVRNTTETIRSWEKLAGGPWKSDTDYRRVKFFRTLNLAKSSYNKIAPFQPSFIPESEYFTPAVSDAGSSLPSQDDSGLVLTVF